MTGILRSLLERAQVHREVRLDMDTFVLKGINEGKLRFFFTGLSAILSHQSVE